jgi:TatD DNase family protein
MRLIDSHCHLQAAAFDTDRRAVIAAAREAGVERLLVPGWDLDSSIGAIELANSDGVDASAGVHPHVAAGVDDDTWLRVVELADLPGVVAIGETGLDYERAFSPRVAQLVNLRRHLRLGKALGKPVILHCRSRPGEREAHDDLLHELAHAGAGTPQWPTEDGRPPALLHSISGPVDYAERALAMGLAVSFSGLVFRAGEEATAEIARRVPADRLLVETDSPYLSPPGAPRRRNEPLWVTKTATWLAAQRNDDERRLGRQLVVNYDLFFGRR